MDRQLAFERQMDMKRLAVPHSPRAARDRGDLPVTRLVRPPQRPKHLGPGLRVLREHNLHPARLEDLHRAPFDVIVIRALCGGQQQVSHSEVWVIDSRTNQTARLQMAQPDFARDVGLNTRAVTFAGDFARAMPHLGQRFERAFDVAVRGAAVAFDAGDDRASVTFLFDSQ